MKGILGICFHLQLWGVHGLVAIAVVTAAAGLVAGAMTANHDISLNITSIGERRIEFTDPLEAQVSTKLGPNTRFQRLHDRAVLWSTLWTTFQFCLIGRLFFRLWRRASVRTVRYCLQSNYACFYKVFPFLPLTAFAFNRFPSRMLLFVSMYLREACCYL